jgi:hypothetical protein
VSIQHCRTYNLVNCEASDASGVAAIYLIDVKETNGRKLASEGRG